MIPHGKYPPRLAHGEMSKTLIEKIKHRHIFLI